MCSFIHDHGTLTSYLYGELAPVERGAFESHLETCAACRNEVRSLQAVRDDLLAWAPPECRDLPSSWAQTPAAQPAWRAWMPYAGLAAAAVLVLAAAASIAHLEVRYDAEGFAVRMGRAEAPVTVARENAAPVQFQPAAVTAADLAALEQRLAATFSVSQERSGLQRVALTSSNPQLPREVRRLIEESEERARRETAAQLLKVYSEWDARRRSDYLAMQQLINNVQTRTGAEIAQLNRIILAAQQQPPQAQPLK